MASSPTPSSKDSASFGLVSLVGAGPGDPELLTVKALRRLREAEVVAYDRLVNPVLLRDCRRDAELVYVGKHDPVGGRPTCPQEHINALLVARARAGKRVVRLKGGDPFVFGRGGEEALALAQAGVMFEIVPGVSSALAVPAYAGIPVTHRHVAASFAVVAGHEDPSKEGSSHDWSALARLDTLVVLMGVERLGHIAAELVKHGRDPETPAALVQWGTTVDQRTLVGTLATLPEQARAAGFAPPATLVIGAVVTLRETLAWFEPQALEAAPVGVV